VVIVAAALVQVGTGVLAAEDWIELLAPAELGEWRLPVGDWREAADAAPAAADPARLTAVPGRGAIVNGDVGRTGDLLTRREFGDVELHVEFLVPRGSNSGVYLMGRYEIQVLDSFGNESMDYPGNQCGGIYPRWLDGANVGGRPPRVNAGRPAGDWQSFDITFRAPRFDAEGRKVAHARFERVLHNGVLVHENAEVTGPTRAARFENAADETTAGPLQLQGDHGPVAFRNLRIRPLDPEPAARPLSGHLYAMDTVTKQRYPESDYTLEQQLDLVRDAGYAGVTWEELSPQDTQRLVDAAAARGLRVAALYYGATVTRDGVSWNPTLPETMRLLKDTGTIIWLHVVSSDFPRSSPDADPIAVPAFRELAELAAANGLRVAIYPHTGDWTERIQDATRVARLVGHPAFGVTFNLCHCLMAGDEEDIHDLLAEASPYLFIATVNGADSAAAGTSWQRLIQTLDRGTFDVESVLRTLHELPFTGPVIFQGFGLQGDVPDNLRRSMTAWRRMMGAIGTSGE
jgi:sugar phosphate isomerase/epimerase